jgi:hypothetical protein
VVDHVADGGVVGAEVEDAEGGRVSGGGGHRGEIVA